MRKLMLHQKWVLLQKPTSTLIVLFIGVVLHAQTIKPGGIATGFTAWFKANTTLNGTMNTTAPASNVTAWNSELGGISLSQGTVGRQPLLQATGTAYGNFNFNPFVQFISSNTTYLFSANTSTNLLGTAGTVFMVFNTYGGRGPTGFTYMSSSTSRYQAKPGFRMQAGSSGLGYTADFYETLVPLTAPLESGYVITSRGNGSIYGGRKNGAGVPLTNSADGTYNPAINSGLYIGGNATSESFNGGIAEIIMYNTTLSDADANKVESYLALKYGVTLIKSNYTAADGTIFWDTTARAPFVNNITGIGRDDSSALLQKQSKSVHYNWLVSVYNGVTGGAFPASNVANSAAITADKSFVLVGDNGLGKNLTSCLGNGSIARMPRIWKTQKTGTGISSVTIALDNDSVSSNVTRMMVSQDSSFPAGATAIYTLTRANGKAYTALTLNNNDYFTFITDTLKATLTATAPGCLDSLSGNVAAIVSGGNAPYTYSWTPSGQTNATLLNVKTGTYTVIIGQGNCSIAAQVVVPQAVAPAAPVATSDSVCPGGTSKLTIQNANASYKYYWYAASTGGSKLDSGIVYTTPAVTPPASYYASLTYGNCTSSRGIVPIYPFAVLPAPVITITTRSENSISFAWQPVAGATGYLVSVDAGAYTAPSSGSTGTTHIVAGLSPVQTVGFSVMAQGVPVCKTSAAATVSAKTLATNVYIPSAFTPNGDGKNDVFKIYSTLISAMDMKIFNQWGELVFSTSNPGDGWNGTYKGKMQPVGVYMYAVRVRLVDGTDLSRKGSLTLVH